MPAARLGAEASEHHDSWIRLTGLRRGFPDESRIALGVALKPLLLDVEDVGVASRIGGHPPLTAPNFSHANSLRRSDSQ
jgi:hypothetical protein